MDAFTQLMLVAFTGFLAFFTYQLVQATRATTEASRATTEAAKAATKAAQAAAATAERRARLDYQSRIVCKWGLEPSNGRCYPILSVRDLRNLPIGIEAIYVGSHAYDQDDGFVSLQRVEKRKYASTALPGEPIHLDNVMDVVELSKTKDSVLHARVVYKDLGTDAVRQLDIVRGCHLGGDGELVCRRIPYYGSLSREAYKDNEAYPHSTKGAWCGDGEPPPEG